MVAFDRIWMVFVLLLLASGAKAADRIPFAVNCVNLPGESENVRIFLQFQPQLLHIEAGIPKSELRVNVQVRKADQPNILENEYHDLTFNFENKGGRKDFRATFSKDLAPGQYTIGIEVEDRMVDQYFYRELPFTVRNPALDFQLSDILFFEDPGNQIEPRNLLIESRIPEFAEQLNFFSEVTTTQNTPLTVRAVLFRESGELGQLATQKYAQIARISEVVEPENGKATLTGNFELSDLGAGTYLLEVYLYSEEKLVAETFRGFTLAWEQLDVVLGQLPVSIRQMKYVAPQEEIEQMLAIKDPIEQQEAFLEWWALAAENKSGTRSGHVDPGEAAMVEYFRTIYDLSEEYAEEGNGWDTDRGQIRFRFGTPDAVQTLEHKGKSYLVWTFDQWELTFLFQKVGKGFKLLGKQALP